MKEVTKVMYETYDGKLFLNRNECIAYEKDALYRDMVMFFNGTNNEDWDGSVITPSDVKWYIENNFETIKKIIEG